MESKAEIVYVIYRGLVPWKYLRSQEALDAAFKDLPKDGNEYQKKKMLLVPVSYKLN